MRLISLLTTTACLGLLACASPKQPSSLGDGGGAPHAAATGALDPNFVVATIDGKQVKGAELNDEVKDEVQKATNDFEEKLQKTREEGLEELIDDKILDIEAKARSVSKEDLIKQEITGKVPAPTEEQMQALYAEASKQQPGLPPYDVLKGRIEEQLSHDAQAERAKTYIDTLRAKYHVKLSLPVHRVVVEAKGPARGPATAKVTMVEFSDFECPYCGRATPIVDELSKKYGDKLRVVFRQFPLPMHQFAEKAAEAALCANEQGKFWDLYSKMFGNQEKLEITDIKQYAKDVGLDSGKFDSCLDGGKEKAAVDADVAAGSALGVDGTPAFFINGRPYSGALPKEKFEEVIDAELANG